MFTFIKKLFNKNENKPEPSFNIKYFQIEDLDKLENAFEDIYNRQIDCIIIKNALDESTIEKLIEFMHAQESNLADKNFIPENRGFTYPLPFSEAPSEKEERKAYFEQNEKDRAFINENLSIEDTIIKTFEKLNNNRPILIPKGEDDKGTYLGFTFRKLVPNYGNLPIHCGNVFQQNFKGFYSHLDSVCSVKNQLSYFYTLQSSNGGELILFDKEWKDGQQMDGIKHVFRVDGTPIDSDDEKALGRVSIPTSRGDLLIFAGGEIWHSVNEVGGPKDRITMGGFMAFSNDHKNLVVWS